MKKCFSINNVNIIKPIYEVNEYILLKQDREDKTKTWVYIKENQNEYYGNKYLFFYALLLAVPKVHFDIGYREKEKEESIDSYYLYKDTLNNIIKTPMFNIYFDENIINYSSDSINDVIINKIKNALDIVVKHAQNHNTTGINRWHIAFDNYKNAYRSLSIEVSIQNLITALEALLLKYSGELSFRTSLYSSLIFETDVRKRKAVFDLVHEMYEIRSKSVHGSISATYKKLKEIEYTKYYRLKEIVSEILIKTYGMEETKIFDSLNNMVYTCVKFEDYLKI